MKNHPNVRNIILIVLLCCCVFLTACGGSDGDSTSPAYAMVAIGDELDSPVTIYSHDDEDDDLVNTYYLFGDCEGDNVLALFTCRDCGIIREWRSTVTADAEHVLFTCDCGLFRTQERVSFVIGINDYSGGTVEGEEPKDFDDLSIFFGGNVNAEESGSDSSDTNNTVDADTSNNSEPASLTWSETNLPVTDDGFYDSVITAEGITFTCTNATHYFRPTTVSDFSFIPREGAALPMELTTTAKITSMQCFTADGEQLSLTTNMDTNSVVIEPECGKVELIISSNDTLYRAIFSQESDG